MIEALTDWNEWWTTGKIDQNLLGHQRELTTKADDLISFREIKTVTGLRRSGKSTILYQLINELLTKKKINPLYILFVNFEDPTLSKATFEQIFNAYQTHINPQNPPYLFLDEVHRCSEWVLFLRKLYDLKKIKQTFITDSSSKFISSEYASALTGRRININVFPLSFKEYLKWHTIPAKSLRTHKDINNIRHHLHLYLHWGGLPEIVLKPSESQKKILLNDYLGDIILRDIVERYNVNYQKIKGLVDYLVANPGTLFSPRKHSRISGISLDALNTYLGYLEEVFFIYAIPRFSYSVRSQQINPKKIYLADTGFFSSPGFHFSINLGHIYENVVLLDLLRRNKEVYYWKDKGECDFIIKDGTKISQAIQICSTDDTTDKKRELKGLVEAMKSFTLTKGIIITTDQEKTEQHDGCTIQYKPLWKYLLEDEKKSTLVT